MNASVTMAAVALLSVIDAANSAIAPIRRAVKQMSEHQIRCLGRRQMAAGQPPRQAAPRARGWRTPARPSSTAASLTAMSMAGRYGSWTSRRSAPDSFSAPSSADRHERKQQRDRHIKRPEGRNQDAVQRRKAGGEDGRLQRRRTRLAVQRHRLETSCSRRAGIRAAAKSTAPGRRGSRAAPSRTAAGSAARAPRMCQVRARKMSSRVALGRPVRRAQFVERADPANPPVREQGEPVAHRFGVPQLMDGKEKGAAARRHAPQHRHHVAGLPEIEAVEGLVHQQQSDAASGARAR